MKNANNNALLTKREQGVWRMCQAALWTLRLGCLCVWDGDLLVLKASRQPVMPLCIMPGVQNQHFN